MSKDPNPSYPNPTIQEAICALRFVLPPGTQWNGQLFGDFIRRVAPEFPGIEPVLQVNFQLQVSQQEVGQSISQPPQTLQFRHKERNLILQLTDGLLSIHVLPKYDSWQNMKLDVLKAWGNLVAATSVVTITQVSVRYINLIPRTDEGETVGYWLSHNDFIPKGLLGSKPPFFSRVDARLDDLNRCIVNLAFQPPPQMPDGRNLEYGGIVLDIERGIFNSEGARLSVEDAIEHLHDGVYDIFRSAKTKALDALLCSK